jgi:hypothetical protein
LNKRIQRYNVFIVISQIDRVTAPRYIPDLSLRVEGVHGWRDRSMHARSAHRVVAVVAVHDE